MGLLFTWKHLGRGWSHKAKTLFSGLHWQLGTGKLEILSKKIQSSCKNPTVGFVWGWHALSNRGQGGCDAPSHRDPLPLWQQERKIKTLSKHKHIHGDGVTQGAALSSPDNPASGWCKSTDKALSQGLTWKPTRVYPCNVFALWGLKGELFFLNPKKPAQLFLCPRKHWTAGTSRDSKLTLLVGGFPHPFSLPCSPISKKCAVITQLGMCTSHRWHWSSSALTLRWNQQPQCCYRNIISAPCVLQKDVIHYSLINKILPIYFQ